MNKSVLLQFRRFCDSKKPVVPQFSRYTKPIMDSEVIEPKILNIAEKEDFKALFTPELNKLRGLFDKNNFEIRMAGGAVRDLLMGIKPSDVDFASTATPDDMKDMFTRENIRMLHKRGEEHGTITCRIDDKDNFEITTLRIDVLCDGRRAEVQYTTNWQLDANRRDLTINSLFLDMDGNVIDYFNGIEDCARRQIHFVGAAAQRIQEDFLRILRYFRFYGRIANFEQEHSAATLEAIRTNKDGLKGVSGERIWTELRKILVGRFAGAVVKCMLDDCGLHEYLGLQPSISTDDFLRIDREAAHRKPHHATMLAALLSDLDALALFHKRAKISNAEKNLAEFIIGERDQAAQNKSNVEYFKEILVDRERAPNVDRKKLTGRECVTELMKYICVSDQIFADVNAFQPPEFPIRGTDLMDVGAPTGKGMRVLLQLLYDNWKKNAYSQNKEELLKAAVGYVEQAEAQAEKERSEAKANRKRKADK
ncbi:hypothetical protein L596_011053 [Steinernema carpocapsae]|uniref:Poly A polymerase head domain-containing protein n=1 Tax=Steinernema carpocapsae TaxID=34508 RepID=A0A4U5NTK2_STECR|nr:hypothetical protein L596_011053 [Steinernema carpocapsae]